MTKAEVIAAIVEQTEVNKEDVQKTVESFFNVIQESMEKGENIYVRGFGSFINKKRAQKIARNISENVSMVIEAHYVPSFKPAKTFIKKVKESTTLTKRLREEEEKQLKKEEQSE